MPENNNPDKINFLPIEKLLMGKTFVVKSYQRGYKWEKNHVISLLNDFQEHFTDNSRSFYCLQPLVVAKIETSGDDKAHNISFEVIDGQQRLTTLYLLLSYLKYQINKQNSLGNVDSSITYESLMPYEIQYETRKDSRDFLNDIFTRIEDIEDLEDLNSDIYHFIQALITIRDWFKEKLYTCEPTQKNKNLLIFKENILKNVAFIWYPIHASENKNESIKQVSDVFINLNQGKIPLTGAELVKALFVLSIKKTEKNIAIR